MPRHASELRGSARRPDIRPAGGPAALEPEHRRIGFLGIFNWYVAEDRVIGDSGLAELFNIDERDLVRGLPIGRFLPAIHPEDIDRVRGSIAEACETVSDYMATYRVRRADSTWRWITALGKCVTGESGMMQFSGVFLEGGGMDEGPRNPQARVSLPPRETQCLDWCSQGKTNWEIGRILGISERTVEHHISSALRRLGANSRVQGVALALRLGLIA